MWKFPDASSFLRIFLTAACLLVGPVSTPFPAEAQAADRTLHALVAQAPPFCYRDDQGTAVGYECAILKSFAEASGRTLKITWLDIDLVSLFSMLESGEGDLISSALTITPERLERFDFTQPYFPTMMVVVERRGQESNSLEDLRGKKIAAEKGSSYAEVVRSIPGATLVEPKDDFDYRKMFQHVVDGTADAIAIDSSFYLWYAEEFPELTLTLALSEREYYGFVLRPDDPLKAELDAHIDTLKESGQLRRFLSESFGKWGEDAIDELAEGFLDGASSEP